MSIAAVRVTFLGTHFWACSGQFESWRKPASPVWSETMEIKEGTSGPYALQQHFPKIWKDVLYIQSNGDWCLHAVWSGSQLDVPMPLLKGWVEMWEKEKKSMKCKLCHLKVIWKLSRSPFSSKHNVRFWWRHMLCLTFRLPTIIPPDCRCLHRVDWGWS